MKLLILMLLASIATTGVTISASKDEALETSVGEILELRGEQLKVFDLGNGTYEYRYYTNPVHYWDGYSMKEITEKENDVRNKNEIFYNINENIIQNFRDVTTNSYLYENFLSKNSTLDETLYGNFKSPKKQINNEYMISANGLYIFPSATTSILTESGDYQTTTTYSMSNLLNENIVYPLATINETIILDESANVIKDKYITLGMSGYTESSTLLAGTDRLQFSNDNGQLVTAEYVSILELNLPRINANYLVSAEIHISKNYTSNDSFRNPNISLNMITNNINYNDIQGTSTLTNSFLSSGSGSLKNYNFDITNQVINSLNDNGKLLLSVEGSSSGYASFYSSNSSSASSPYLSLVVEENNLGGTLYGSAPEYYEISSGITNCLGYSLLKNYGVELYLSSISPNSYTAVKAQIEFIINQQGYEIRELNNYDSDIYSNERRIAFRYNPRNLNEWHFVMQNNNGAWSAKLGTEGSSGQYDIFITPEDDCMWNVYNGLISGNTHYFAIK